MSQIKPSLVISCLALTLILYGCGDKNQKTVTFEREHEAGWIATHKDSARAAIDKCTECHGSDYKGGISQVSCMSTAAISGFKCHVGSPADNPTGCVSCHGSLPSGPFGTASPNRNFAHATHTALLTILGTTGNDICSTCHLGAGNGTADHASATAAGDYKTAQVTLTPSLKLSTLPGQLSYVDGKCTLVSCHGGIVTPAWTDTINMATGGNAACYQCHQQGDALGTPQYNSFYSGMHASHLDRGASCTDCHNLNVLTNAQTHFAGIPAKIFTVPGNTIGNNGSTAPTKIGSYDKSSKTCSSVLCHPQPRKWNN